MTETTVLPTKLENLLSVDEVRDIDAYWRAANYLSVGQIYLLDNPLLQEPLRLAHIKPRLLGHWGTTPGLNLIYVHLNRVIKARNLNVLFVTGPGSCSMARAAWRQGWLSWHRKVDGAWA
jgi:xylulose-5-phosphate/fructose-6-phosphate phosphoketolase